MYLNEWGPIAWELFHYITYTYKPVLKEYYYIFFTTLYSIIPCPHCSNDIKETLTTYDNQPSRYIQDRNSIINWYIRIHNIVNKKLNVKDNFSRVDADLKYLNNNDISIDHNRILQFIKLLINIKGKNKEIETDSFFRRNIISLCSIYPIGIDLYNPNLMYYINYKNISNTNYIEWYDIFEKLVLNKSNHIKWNNIKYPIRSLEYNENNLHHIQMLSNPVNKIMNNNHNIIIRDYPEFDNSSILIVSANSNQINITKSYEVYNDINKLFIYMRSHMSSNNSIINIKININSDIKEHTIRNKEETSKIEYSNIVIFNINQK